MSRSVTFDPYLGDAEVREAVTALRDGDWRPVQQAMESRSDAWLLVTILIADESPVPLSSFETWAKASPSALSVALLGQAHTLAAWRIRGRTMANQVDPGAWKGFHEGLIDAEVILERALEMDSASAEPWVGLMTTARGLGLGRRTIRERFDHSHEVSPFRPDATATMLQGLCDKWGGSHEEMFAFARWVESDAAPDSAAHATIHIAHFEYIAAMADEGIRASEYLALPDVATELLEAAERFLAATAGQRDARHLTPLNMILFTVQPNNPRSAAVIIDVAKRIDCRPTPTPWVHFPRGIAGSYMSIRDEQVRRALKVQRKAEAGRD